MLDMKVEGNKIRFTESGEYFNTGYTIDLSMLSLQELQILRSTALKVYFDKLKEK